MHELTGIARCCCRTVSHLGFASIKAAICASVSHDAGGSTPPAGAAAAPGAEHAHAMHPAPLGAHAAPGEVASAVVAVLSPRANQAQAHVLAGVFGGAGAGISDSSSITAAGSFSRAACSRRITWGADDACMPGSSGSALLSPGAVALSPKQLQHMPHEQAACGDDRQLPQLQLHAPHSFSTPPRHVGGGRLLSPPPPGQPHAGPLSRHLSMTLGSPAGAGAVVGSPSPASAGLAGGPPQRSSSSSLQALASLKLDATLASISHEARHDGVLAERLAHWRGVFRAKSGPSLHSGSAAVLFCCACTRSSARCCTHTAVPAARPLTLLLPPPTSRHAKVLSWRAPSRRGRSATAWRRCCQQAFWTAATRSWTRTNWACACSTCCGG